MEHRWGKRSVVDIGVRLHLAGGSAVTGRLVNTSLSGGFVNTPEPVAAFAQIGVELEGAAQSIAPPRIDAYVVRTTPTGLGLEWSEFASPAIAKLLGRYNKEPRWIAATRVQAGI